ncbi:hypothetical protein NDU88_001767 [Pleurodeles waltl]|uniref:Uncharacterized protein n=1 Tax=Pleurodeles waltl TaxID=8319 RepID=A0AAV7SAT2_PLEWA|nr:hypothetical protein NDU88_001767 [Pleurodeles waltl]
MGDRERSSFLCELEGRRTSRKTFSAVVRVSVTSLELRRDRSYTLYSEKRISPKLALVRKKSSRRGSSKSMNSDDDEEEQAPEIECETINKEYPFIEFFPMFTVKELHPDLQRTVKEKVWDLTGEEVGLIKEVEPV